MSMYVIMVYDHRYCFSIVKLVMRKIEEVKSRVHEIAAVLTACSSTSTDSGMQTGQQRPLFMTVNHEILK